MKQVTDMLIEDIRKKPELSSVSISVIKELLQDYSKKNNIKLENLKNKDRKTLIKDIRAELRILVGRFQKNDKLKRKFSEQSDFNLLLKTHSSTNERLENYKKIKDILIKLKINSILDLGCGLNPLALAEKKYIYNASDINEQDLKIVKEYFKINKIKGKVFVYDIRKISPSLPNADICFLFKILDIIEVKGHKLAEKIITSLQCNYILVSFATVKLSGKPMSNPNRFWLENMLKRIGLHYEKIHSKNELFYLIYKIKQS